MIARYLQGLRPSAQAVRELALRETDPARARQFEAIARGPLVNGALLLLVGIAAAVTLPVRLIASSVRKR